MPQKPNSQIYSCNYHGIYTLVSNTGWYSQLKKASTHPTPFCYDSKSSFQLCSIKKDTSNSLLICINSQYLQAYTLLHQAMKHRQLKYQNKKVRFLKFKYLWCFNFQWSKNYPQKRERTIQYNRQHKYQFKFNSLNKS